MLVKSFAAAVQGISATIITIEVNCTKGIQFFLVGLPDVAVRESHERIISAMEVNGYRFPHNRIVINMAPADIRKEGSAYDLPLAIGIMAAAGQLDASKLEHFLLMGELSLDGSLLPIKGVLPIAIKAREAGFKGFILPKQNAREAAVVNKLEVYGVNNVREVIEFMDGKRDLEPTVVDTRKEFYAKQEQFDCDFADVKGQEHVKRALEVAASGGHNLLMVGSPGSGKSMLAKRLPSILPPFTLQESLETTKIHSVAGKLDGNSSLMAQRPFRSPHHTISNVAMVGGGSFPQPGEISLAHNGVLYLDELPEFNRSVLEVMRQPLEDRKINISRARFSVEYPAGFMLVASMNPCPCGYYNHPDRACLCSPGAVQKYMNRISGPLLDRIDIQVEITPVPFEKLADRTPGESSAVIRERVIRARQIQADRFARLPGIYCNAQMATRQLQQFAQPNEAGLKLLKNAMLRLNLSARAYDRILKVARTIADLEGSEQILSPHLAEAISYRNLDRENWAERNG
ncbi:MAG: YifB family Mg chelatase-like AAA ATPase [Parabacteroides sp.]